MQMLSVGEGEGLRKIAVEQRVALKTNVGPGLFWLGGFKSDMNGSKATALDEIGGRNGVGVTRFDYSGSGQSGGKFIDGTITRWLEECACVFETCTSGEQILVGSSMGGWLAFLLNKQMRKKGDMRIRALVVIAPAVDMTNDLMYQKFTTKMRAELQSNGSVQLPSAYDEPYILTNALIKDGASHLLFGKPINPGCPIYILQGGKDEDVPLAHSLKLVSHLLSDPVTLSVVPDGDHSLSREPDLALLEKTIAQAVSNI